MNIKKELPLTTLTVAIIFLLVAITVPIQHEALNVAPCHARRSITTTNNTVTIGQIDISDEWELFTAALIHVESSGNPRAVNSHSGAVGLFQILPLEGDNIGYLHEYNRLNPHSKYKTADLYDPQVQWRIFNFIQAHHNPTHCINRAIELHNGRAGDWYKARIVHRMNEIKNK